MNLKKKHGMILSMAIQTCKLPKLALRMCPCISFGVSVSNTQAWLCTTDGAICFLCKVDIETVVSRFFLDCLNFREYFDPLWANLTVKVMKSNDTDGRQTSEFITKLDRHQKALLLLECLSLPFDAATVTMITRFIAAAVGKIYKFHAERLCELNAPWLSHWPLFY